MKEFDTSIFEIPVNSVSCSLIRIRSTRPYSVKDCGAYEYVLKNVFYSDNEVFSAIRNVCNVGIFPSPSRCLQTGRTVIYGSVDASICRFLSHSTKAVLRSGVLCLDVNPEDLGQEFVFAYLRYIVVRAPKFEIPVNCETYFLG